MEWLHVAALQRNGASKHAFNDRPLTAAATAIAIAIAIAGGMAGAMHAILSSLTKFPPLDFGQVTGFWNLLQVWHRL